MDKNKDKNTMWLAPKKIYTENIIEEIEKYLGKSISDNYETLNTDLKDKIRVLTERIEFIEHLLVFAEFIKKNSKIKKRTVEELTNDKDSVLVKIDYEFILLKKNLAGANFDIEALIFYLLVTCIDTLKGKPQYRNPFEWLTDKIDTKNEDIRNQLKKLKEEYKNEFGLSHRFIEVFTKDIDTEVQNELINNLISVKLNDSKINKNSLKAWERSSDESKLRKIANTLYDIRSSYTHTSIRTFLPSQPLKYVPNLNGEYLLCHKQARFVDLMKKVIISLTENTVKNSIHN